MLPDVVLEVVNILDDCLHLLRTSEAVPIHQSLIFLQKVFDWLLDVAQEARCKFGSNQGHGSNAKCWCIGRRGCWHISCGRC